MRIVVVGAGIAGLVSAVAAYRSGHQVTLLERSSAGSAAGAGISLFGNALRGLDTLPSAQSALVDLPAATHGSQTRRAAEQPAPATVGDRVRAVGGSPAATGPVGIRTPAGRWLIRAAMSDGGPQTPESEVVVVHRGDLQRVLLQELPAGVTHFDSTVTGVQQHDEGATVHWTGPAGPADSDADLVVAADGINSPLRRAWWPDDPGPRYAGYTSWRGITSGPVALQSGGETWGRGERFGIAPLHDGRVYWFATASLPSGSTFADERAELLRRFGGWHDPIPALISGTAPQAVLHHDINELAGPMRTFVHGRVVLVGDSAHAMTPDLGQGGCQAIEDAVTLVALVNTEGLPGALHRYDGLRRRRTQPLAARARRIGRIGQLRSSVGVRARDAALRLIPGRAFVRASRAVARWSPPDGHRPSRS